MLLTITTHLKDLLINLIKMFNLIYIIIDLIQVVILFRSPHFYFIQEQPFIIVIY